MTVAKIYSSLPIEVSTGCSKCESARIVLEGPASTAASLSVALRNQLHANGWVTLSLGSKIIGVYCKYCATEEGYYEHDDDADNEEEEEGEEEANRLVRR